MASEPEVIVRQRACAVCGAVGEFRYAARAGSPARDGRCPRCDAALIFQSEAAVLVEELSDGRQLCLDALLADGRLAAARIHYFGQTGPIRKRLRTTDHYSESIWVDGLASGTELRPRGRTAQDHTALSFDDATFDLLVSSHILEHVPDPVDGLREAGRVLKPGGRYVFSIPCRWPLPAASVVRARLTSTGIEHLTEPAFHRSPEGEPALVFTDFGADIVQMAADAGLSGRIVRPFADDPRLRRLFVVVATKAA